MQRLSDLKKVSLSLRFTMLLIALTTMMSNVAIVTALPHLKDYFTYTQNIEFLARLMLTLPSLAIAFLAPILGHVIYKIGRKKSALFALTLFSIAGSSGLFLDTMNLLLFSRFILGIAIAVLMIVSTSLIGDYFQGEARHKFMGQQGLFISLGGVIFVVGGGILSDINWRYSFAIYSIGFLLIPLVYTYLNEKVISDFNTEDDSDLNSNLLIIYFLAFLLMLVFYILPTQIPFLIMNHFDESGTMTGAIIATAFISNGIGAITFRKFKQRFTHAQIYVMGMFIIGFGFIAIGLVDNVYYFFLTSPIMGFGGGILMTNMTAWMLSRTHHTKRIHKSGYLTSALFLGQFFSPIFFHPIVSFFSIENFFIIVGVGILTITVINYFIFRKVILQ
jgi:MFS family permease